MSDFSNALRQRKRKIPKIEQEKLFDNLKNAPELDCRRVNSADADEYKRFVSLIAMMLHSLSQKSFAASKQELGRRVEIGVQIQWISFMII